MMNHGKLAIITLMFCSLLSCGGGSDNTTNNEKNGIFLAPSDTRANQRFYRSVVSTQSYAYVAARPGISDSSGVMIFPLAGLNLTSNQTINEVNYVELNQTTATLALAGNILFAGGDKVKVLNISDPVNPVEILTLDSSAITGLKIFDQYLFAFNGFLSIYNIADPSNPVFINIITKAGFSATYANDILYASSITLAKNGQTQYTYENSKIHIIDIKNPANPVFLNEIQLKGEAYHLGILDNYLIAVVEDYNIPTTFLQVYSLTDPNNPVLKDELEFNSIYRAFGLNNSYGVISGFWKGFMFKINSLGKIEALKNNIGGSANTGDGFPYHIDVQPDYAIIPGNGYAKITPSL